MTGMNSWKKDKVELDLNLEDKDIQCYTKEQFRNIVKQKIEKCAGKVLNQLKNSHSKTENLKSNGFEPASYLKSKNLTQEEVRTLFQLRTRMNNVKGNLSSAHTSNMWCKLCLLFTET